MKLTAKIKLQPTPEQADALRRTLTQANAACDYISQVAWQERTFKQFAIHSKVYRVVKEQFGLSAQMTVRAIAKVADSYKLDKATCRTFKPTGGIAYDSRILRYKPASVSIWTVDGRFEIPFTCGDRQRAQLANQKGESDLLLIDGEFYLYATCEVTEDAPYQASEYLGCDLGIKNILTDSTGETYAGNHLNSLRKRHAKLRARLQSKGTKSARRLLKKRRRKEKRMANHVNHVIAKRVVKKAKRHSMGIALEELTGIRQRVTVRKGQRRQHHAWAFHDLRQKIEYKARLAGVPVVCVDPRYTSKACQVCGCVDKKNRPNQETFLCVSCGFSAHADKNAAINIGRRASVNTPYASTTPLTHLVGLAQ